jgi:alpha-glucosidase
VSNSEGIAINDRSSRWSDGGRRSRVVYQIFVDRFRRAAPPHPSLRPWHLGPEEPPTGRDRYGGDLDGVTEGLDHVRALGADAVYLTPIFPAPSNHRYDTTDFDAVDPSLGGDRAFDRLCARARALGIGVILDGVFNHVGEAHPWARDPAYGTSVPWRGYGHLRELKLAERKVRDALFGEHGVVARWIRRGATGWRLDCANDLGHEVCGLAAAAARNAGAVDGTIGEVMAYPAAWAGPGGLDGVMNYWLRQAALQLGTGGEAGPVQGALDRLARDMDPEALRRSWNVVSSHDTPRLSHLLDGVGVRSALLLQFAYPGTPMIYYGEEIGMSGGADPANRAGMVWDERRWDRERLGLCRRLIGLHQSEPALQSGGYTPLPQPGTEVVAFARTTPRAAETVLFVANLADRPVQRRLFLPLEHLYDAVPLRDLLDGWQAQMEQGCLEVTLPPRGARLLRPIDDHPSGYRFFKNESVLESRRP